MKFCKNKYFVYDSCFSPQQQPDDAENFYGIMRGQIYPVK